MKNFLKLSHFAVIYQLVIQSSHWKPVAGTKRLGSSCHRPKDFPQDIHIHHRKYENWIGDIKIASVWIAVPKTAEDVVEITNWAGSSGYRIRAKGGGHAFAPLTLSKKEASEDCPKILLVDTTRHLKNMVIKSNKENSRVWVEVETGAMLEDLLEFLERHGFGLFQTPPLGDISIGGMLATGTYGTGIPGHLDNKSPGHSYGCMSNLIIDMTIVAWDPESSSYNLKTLHRSHKDCKAFMTHVGRTFVTSVSLSIGKNQNLRKLSRTDISVDELFANPDKTDDSTRTITHLANKYGRVEVIVLPFGKYPMTMIQYNSPEKPKSSRKISGPYPYLFLNFSPRSLDLAARYVMTTATFLAKYLGTFGYMGYTLGTAVTFTKDLWGPSKNHFLYVDNPTIHLNIDGYSVVTSPQNLQKVIFLLQTHWSKLLDEYAERKLYPVNGGLDYRITGTDNTEDLVNVHGDPSCLSPMSPVAGKPEFTRVVMFSPGSFPNTPSHSEFMTDFENFLFTHFDGRLALVRPAWSKGWGYTKDGAWTNFTLVKNVFPKLYKCGDEFDGFRWAADTFTKYDPKNIFLNAFLEGLFS